MSTVMGPGVSDDAAAPSGFGRLAFTDADLDGLTADEVEIVSCYRALYDVVAKSNGELAPFAERNVIKALGSLWQVVNGLGLDAGQPYDVGV